MMATWRTPPKNPTMPVPTLSSSKSTSSAASSPATKQDASRSHQIGATRTLLSSTYLMPTISDQSPSKTGQRKNSSARTVKHTNGSYCKGSNPNSANWTMKLPMRWKHLSAHNPLTSSTHHQTCIVPPSRTGHTNVDKIIFYQGSWGPQSPSPSPTGADSPPNAMPPSTCSTHFAKIPSYWLTKPSKAHSPSTQHPWHHSGQKYWCT
jgi:hypothetical protein